MTTVGYRTTPASHRTHTHAQTFDDAMRRAEAVAEVAFGLRASGFQPDLVIGHDGWGEMLRVGDVWPGVPVVSFREYFYRTVGADVGNDPEFPLTLEQTARVRARNAVGLLALEAGGPGVSPTAWQRSLYPAWAQPAIRVLADPADLAACCPDPATRAAPFAIGPVQVRPHEALVTFTARSLEPYRGFHTFCRALPAILARPGTRVVCVGNDQVSYGLPPPSGTWRSRMLEELGGRIDPARVHILGPLPYPDYLRLLRRSDVHTYLSYPFIVSWSLREALACGCAVVAAGTDAVREFIRHGETGMLVPPLDPAATAEAVLHLLDDPARRLALGAAARRWAERELTLERHLLAWQGVVREVAGLELAPAGESLSSTIVR